MTHEYKNVSQVKNIRFKSELLRSIDECKGDQSFSEFVKQSVRMRIEVNRRMAEEKGGQINKKIDSPLITIDIDKFPMTKREREVVDDIGGIEEIRRIVSDTIDKSNLK